MEYSVNNLTNFNVDEVLIEKCIKETCKKLKVKNKIVSIVFIDNKEIKKINKTYRNIDKETDVISFAFDDEDTLKSDILGEIYISVDKIQSQAEEYGHSIMREMAFLLVHGLLHLLGYDHMKKEDEEVMFKLQEDILEKIGVKR